MEKLKGFEPAQSNDPIATKTHWFALQPRRVSFQTRTVLEISPTRVQLRPTVVALAFSGLFALVGLGALLAALAVAPDQMAIPLGAFTLIFGGIGVSGLITSLRIPTFDLKLDKYFVGRSTDWRADKLSDVHALQIVSDLSGTKNPSLTFELNLVLKSGSRTSVVSHQDLDGLRSDARQLARFLGVPLWDAEPTR